VHVTEAEKSRFLRLIRFSSLLTLLLLLPTSLIAAALSAVNEDLIVNADGGGRIETVETTRITTLRGNVRIRQGLVTIYGDTAILEQDTVTGDLIRVTVEGTPARFLREAVLSAETINGSSLRIIYYNETPATDAANTDLLSVVEFVGEANFMRGRTALECVEIKHIVETGATDSPGPCVGVFAPATSTDDAATEPMTE
jgi:lipopolysaccharide transport protein LptA